MLRTYSKNTRRTIKETFGRFAAIFAIVALGVGFLVGLLSATPNIRDSFDRYFDKTSMYDIQIIGSLGLTEKDVAEIKKLDSIKNIKAGYFADVLMNAETGSDFTVRMHSLNIDSNYDNINIPEITSGRLPKKSNECVIINIPLGIKTNFKMGDIFSISEKNENAEEILSIKEFEVVGFVDYSPYFSAEKEYTNIGSGTVDLFILVPEESFKTDFYTDVYITVSGARELTALTSEYHQHVDNAVKQIKEISGERSKERYKDFKENSTKKLNEAKLKYNDAKIEAEKQLLEAKTQIEDGKQLIAEGEKKLSEAWNKIESNELALNKSTIQLKRQEEIIAKEFSEAEKKLSEAQTEMDKSLKTVADKLYEAEKELGNFSLNSNQTSAFNDARKLAASYPILIDALKALQDNTLRLNEVGTRLTEIQNMPQYERLKHTDEENSLMDEKSRLILEIDKTTSSEAYVLYSNYATQLAMTGANTETLLPLALKLGSLDAAKLEISKAQAELDSNRTRLDAEKAIAFNKLLKEQSNIEEGRGKISEAKSTYYNEQLKLKDAKAELDESIKKYDAAQIRVENELADGLVEISKAELKVSEIKTPEWYLMTRDDNISYASLKSNIDKVDAIARVFPFFFFLVAALVALTTMTRMVEDERLQIGTMKALGYSSSSIMRKYVLYALLASALGSIFGVSIGFWLFPTVIWNVYTMMYELPEFYCPINWAYSITTSCAVILCILFATINSCRSTLKEKPAQLMLPKAPEAGKRVLLEKITPVWSRMKFTHKVTARNLFRYKKRFFMTVIGVAGCTALLVTGFGLRDSFSEVAHRQFGELFIYDVLAPISSEDDLNDTELLKILNDKSAVSGSVAVNLENVTALYGKNSIDVHTFIPEKATDLKGFINFRTRVGARPIEFNDDSVILTEKASEVLNVKKGDVIILEDKNGNRGNFKISGICENYARNYIYMTEETYTAGMGERAERNTLVISLVDDYMEISDFGRQLLETNVISGVRFNSDAMAAVDIALEKINMIVAVIIISAGVLAFVVLYNLNNINIEERTKEIATIKVLGFTDREVKSYINRESLILSLIGTAVGLLLGIFLHRFVMGKAEMDVMMFGRSVRAISFVFSAILTTVFSILVDLVMARKLRRISMVESMKAPE